MRYRAWVSTATALLLSTTLQAPVYGQSSMVAAPAVTGSTTVPVLNNAAQVALQKAISGNQRIEPARDRARNPAATLQFFGVRPTDTVIEIWPGQGWYTSILGPYLKQGSGSLIIGHFDASSTNSAVVRQIVDAYRARFASDQATYGSVNVVPFGPRSGPLGMPGSADSVLTFRNIHNWMAQGWAEKAFGDFFMVLKPGGILGIEEHRGRTDEPQDPLARDGYVREDFVIQLAREAGFEFIGRSEINANPADTKDHPFGVWTLPPVSRTSALGQRDDPGFDRTRYDAIGESDRMTLRFRKPLNATGAPPSPGTRWSPVIVAPAAPSVVRPAIQAARPTTIVSAGTSPALIVPPPQTARSVTMTTPQVGRTTTLPRGTDLAIAREAAAPRLIEPAPLVVPARVKPPVMIAPPVIAPPTPPPSPPPPPPPPAAVASPMTENPAPSSSIAAPLAPSPAITPDETPASSPMPALTARAIETKPLEAIVAPTVPTLPAAAIPAQTPSVVPSQSPPAAPRSQRVPAAVTPDAAPVARPSRTPRSRAAARPRSIPTDLPRARDIDSPAPVAARNSREPAATAPATRTTPTSRTTRTARTAPRVKAAEVPAASRSRAIAPEPQAKSKSKSAASAAARTATTRTATTRSATTRPVTPRTATTRAAPPPPKATRPSPARPAPPPPSAKKKATPPTSGDPKKPDWVVPRRQN